MHQVKVVCNGQTIIINYTVVVSPEVSKDQGFGWGNFGDQPFGGTTSM